MQKIYKIPFVDGGDCGLALRYSPRDGGVKIGRWWSGLPRENPLRTTFSLNERKIVKG